MPNTISNFKTERYKFLSNFYPVEVEFEGYIYSSVEHAYQAAKTFSEKHRLDIYNCKTPGQAKRLGKKVPMRPDWELVKLDVMKDLLQKKFKSSYLAGLLKGTGDAELVEGNWWGDTYWGVCNGEGENHLGKLLMEIRDTL